MTEWTSPTFHFMHTCAWCCATWLIWYCLSTTGNSMTSIRWYVKTSVMSWYEPLNAAIWTTLISHTCSEKINRNIYRMSIPHEELTKPAPADTVGIFWGSFSYRHRNHHLPYKLSFPTMPSDTNLPFLSITIIVRECKIIRDMAFILVTNGFSGMILFLSHTISLQFSL